MMAYATIDIAAKRERPQWMSNQEILAAYEAAQIAAGAQAGTGLTTRNVLIALRELARVIEPQLLTEATAHGILEYARHRTQKCRHLQSDGAGYWKCTRKGGLAYQGGIAACPLFAEHADTAGCGMYERLMWISQVQHLYALSSSFDWMRSRGAIESNPVADARKDWLLETRHARTLEENAAGLARVLSDEELAMILKACPPPLRRLLQTMAKAGLRIGEALAIRLMNIDFDARNLRVPAGNAYCNKRRGLRVIHMNTELFRIIRQQVRLRRAQPGVTTLFTNRYGQAFSPKSGKQDINKTLQGVACRLGIMGDETEPRMRVTPHCMRRWFSNQLGAQDLGGVALGMQLLLRGDKLPGALARYLDQPTLSAPLWREHMPRLPSTP
jgi:integrase